MSIDTITKGKYAKISHFKNTLKFHCFIHGKQNISTIKINETPQCCKIMPYKIISVVSAKQISTYTGTARIYLYWRDRVKQNITLKYAWFTSIKDAFLEA